MINETLQTVQAKLSTLAQTHPQLETTAPWNEILAELNGLSQNAERQELLLETVAALSDAASSILEVDDLLQVAVNLIQDYFDFYYAGVSLIDEANEVVRLRAATGKAGQQLLQKEQPGRIGGDTLIGWCIHHRQPRIALAIDPPDRSGQPANLAEPNPEIVMLRFQNPVLPDTRSEIVLPLINRGQVIGALDLQSAEATAFSENDIVLFQTLADQLANSIQNARLFTENARLLDQAENSRRFLKTVIEHIPDPIFIKDKNHALLEMNQANAQVIGQMPQALLGKTDQDFLPTELADKFRRRDSQVFATNQIVEAEDKTVWADGREHTAYTRLIPIPNAAGQPEFMLGISHDVTERRAHEAERERLLAETAALYLGSQAIARALSERQIFEAIFDQIQRSEPSEIAAYQFNLVDNEPTWAELRFNYHHHQRPATVVGTRLFLPEFEQRELLTSGRPLFIDNLVSDDRLSAAERASFAASGAHSIAILPLITANQPLGVIVVYFTAPHTFSEDTQRLWLAMADQAGIALINHHLIEEAAYRAIRMEAAAEVARAASSILEVQELLNAAVALIGDRFDLYYAGAFLVEPPDTEAEKEGWAVLKAGTGEAGQIQLKKRHRLKIGGESMIGWSIAHRQPRIALDVGKEAVRFQNPDLPKTRSEIALPLIYHHEVIGALTVQSEEQAAFSREDIIILQTMADLLANAIKNARLYEQAQQEIVERKKAEAALTEANEALESRVEARTTELRQVNEQLLAEIAERKRAEEALRQSESRLRRQNETLVSLAGVRTQQLEQDNLDVIFQSFTEASARALEVERASIWLYDEARSKIICQDLFQLSTQQHTQGLELLKTDYPSYFKALAEEHTVTAHDAHVAPQTKEFSRAYLAPAGITSMLDAPIWIGGRMVGVICHEHVGPARQWSIEEQNFAGSMADMVALALETLERKRAETALQQAYDILEVRVQERTAELAQANVVLEEQITERRRAEEAFQKALQRTQVLYNISEVLTTLLNRRAAFETVLGEYLLLLNVPQGSIRLIDPDKAYNILAALYLDNKVVEPHRVSPVKEDGISQYLRKNPYPLAITEVSTHPLLQHIQSWPNQVEAVLFVPIISRGEVIGVISAEALEKGHLFTPEDIEIGKAIADQLAIWLDNSQLLREAQFRSERLQTAAEVSRAASSILDTIQLIDTSVNLIRDQFGFYYVGLFLVDEARAWAVLQAGTGEAGQLQLQNNHKLKIGGESMIGWCVQNRQARIALDVGQEAVRFQNPYLPDTHSELALPLVSRGEVIGALTVQSTERGAFSDEDITLLQTMADQLANAIQNAQLFESVTAAQKEAVALLKDTQALQQFSKMLAGTLQVSEIMGIFFRVCREVLGFEYGQFALVDKYQNRIKAIAGFEISDAQLKGANWSLDSHDIMAHIIRTGQTEIISGWDERFDRDLFEAEGHANWVRVFTPVTLQQEHIGLVETGFNKATGKSVEESHIRLLRAFVDQTALALDNAQRYEASQKAARRETLIKEITTKVRASTNVETILQTTVKELGDALGGKRTYVHLISPDNGEKH